MYFVQTNRVNRGTPKLRLPEGRITHACLPTTPVGTADHAGRNTKCPPSLPIYPVPPDRLQARLHYRPLRPSNVAESAASLQISHAPTFPPPLRSCLGTRFWHNQSSTTGRLRTSSKRSWHKKIERKNTTSRDRREGKGRLRFSVRHSSGRIGFSRNELRREYYGSHLLGSIGSICLTFIEGNNEVGALL